MNREIKFRGKSKETGEWFYGDLWRREQNGRGDISWFITYPGGRIEEVIPETVGEYTGLKDSLGKEIYEGDIINGSVVGFSGGRFIPRYSHGNQDEWENEFYLSCDDIQVDGNTCENPELLNQK